MESKKFYTTRRFKVAISMFLTALIVAVIVAATMLNVDSTMGNVSADTVKTATKTKPRDTSDATTRELDALGKAKFYLSLGGFSEKSLTSQLKYEGFTKKEITYAIDCCDADWKEQAVQKAQSYLDSDTFPRAILHDQLAFKGFTEEQIEYGLNKAEY